MIRALRGAVVAADNTREAILEASQTLFRSMLEQNHLSVDSVISVFVTATADLNAEFPALAAREIGWTQVPMLCAQEIQVPGSMARVIRVLMHVAVNEGTRTLRHQYLGEAHKLRPDLAEDRQP